MIDGYDLLPSLPGKLESCKKGAKQAPRPIVEFAMVGRVRRSTASTIAATRVSGRERRLVYYVCDRPREGNPTISAGVGSGKAFPARYRGTRQMRQPTVSSLPVGTTKALIARRTFLNKKQKVHIRSNRER